MSLENTGFQQQDEAKSTMDNKSFSYTYAKECGM